METPFVLAERTGKLAREGKGSVILYLYPRCIFVGGGYHGDQPPGRIGGLTVQFAGSIWSWGGGPGKAEVSP
jgi:hypothetical protein